tara:strand:- start:70 stop:318 length:249 start_codon:yes stop_codon:yes gene_type:complete
MDMSLKNRTQAKKKNVGIGRQFAFHGTAKWRKNTGRTGFVAWRTDSIVDVRNIIVLGMRGRFDTVRVDKPRKFDMKQFDAKV